jgi:hypothetical protein
MNTSRPGDRSRTTRLLAPLLLLPLAALGCDRPVEPETPPAEAAVDRARKAATFRVTVHNTTGALQPLTPVAVALHNPATGIFRVGAPASPELERVAESGDLGPLVAALQATNQVFDVDVAFGTVAGQPGPILPGASGSVEVQGPPGLRISLVAMLVCTNDGFTGLRGVRLPKKVGQVLTYRSDGYDAGTEQNTEAAGDLVPPCVMATTGAPGGTGADQPAIAEDEVIRHHPGIDGDTDGDDILDAQHQWTDPVTLVEIERVS